MATLHRFFDPGVTEGEAAAPQFVSMAWGFGYVRLLNNGEVILQPQVAFAGGKLIATGPPDVIEEFLSRLRQGAEPTIRRHVSDVPTNAPPRLIIDKRDKSHLLRSRTETEADALMTVLRQPVQFRFIDVEGGPTKTHLRFALDPNIPGRCTAKMALNMACAVLGPEVILRAEFDPVRNYILGDDVICGTVKSDDGEDGLLIDPRFVEPLEHRATARDRSGTRHSLTLCAVHNRLGAWVSLFGGKEQFTVTLGDFPDEARGKLPIGLWRREDADWWCLPERHISWRYGESPPRDVDAILLGIDGGRDQRTPSSRPEPAPGSE